MKHRLTIVVAAFVLAVAGYTGSVRTSHAAPQRPIAVTPACAGDCTWLGK